MELAAYGAALCLTVPASQHVPIAPDAARLGKPAEDVVVIPAVLDTGYGVRLLPQVLPLLRFRLHFRRQASA